MWVRKEERAREWGGEEGGGTSRVYEVISSVVIQYTNVLSHTNIYTLSKVRTIVNRHKRL